MIRNLSQRLMPIVKATVVFFVYILSKSERYIPSSHNNRKKKFIIGLNGKLIPVQHTTVIGTTRNGMS